jgi:hypothetical protein
MDLFHNPPICNNCRKVKVPANGPEQLQPEGTGLLRWFLKSPDKLRIFIKVGLCVFFLVVLGFTILFQIKGFAWLFEINYSFLRFIPVFFAFLALVCGFIFLKPKSKKAKTIIESITQAQKESLLRTDSKITASRLSKATNTSEEYAKKVLDEMVVDGKLKISAADSYEMTYSKNILS